MERERVEQERLERERLKEREQREQERLKQEREEQEREERELLLRRLRPVETGYHRDLRCMDGTRQSLLNHIMDWVANKSGKENALQSNAYWFYGSPGIGKTSLAHSICANLHERSHLAGAFFCRRDDPNLSEPRNILQTFIHKLAILFPPFRIIVAKHLRDDPNLTPESMKGSLFLDFIRSLPRHPDHTLIFVIDALDECGNDRSRPGILKVLTDAATHAPWLKIIITSRTEVDIQHFFDTLTPSSYLHVTWPQIKMPVLICEPSPEVSSIS
jgi:Cdc6-like AAA superfamily ATPase